MTTRTYRALLIANSTYPGDPQNLPELEGPRNDPALLRDALCDREAGLFPSDNVRLVTERTMAEVLRETEDFLRTATRQDTLLLYYSGHGMLDQTGELFLCTRDTRTDRLRSTAVKASDVGGMINESAASSTVIVLDCCHSGRFKGGDFAGSLAGHGRFVVTSSRGGELANDTDTRNHASVFTHHLVEGLLDGAPDNDGDGVVKLNELYDYVHARLVADHRQVPQKRFEGDGDVPMALRVTPSSALEQSDVLDPAAAPPILDVSDTVIDLGVIDADEVLPPERIAVVNRGGGKLQWSAESSAGWVEPVTDETGIRLVLSPKPGPNRANVYVRDTQTGILKTVRVSVRVRQPRPADLGASPPSAVAALSVPAAAPVIREPEGTVEEPVATQPAEQVPREQAPSPSTSDRWQRLRTTATGKPDLWAAMTSVAAVLVGSLMLASAFTLRSVILRDGGTDLLVRDEIWGPGSVPSTIGGAVLAVAGLLALAPRLRMPMLGIIAGMSLPLGSLRLAEAYSGEESCGCYPGWVTFFTVSGVLCLLVTALSAAALWSNGALTKTRWVRPPALVFAAIGVVVLWGLSLGVEVYNDGSTAFGNQISDRGRGAEWLVAMIVITAAIVFVALIWMLPTPGAGAVVGGATLPALFILTGELVTLADDSAYYGQKMDDFWVLVLSTLVMTGLGLASIVLARRAPSQDLPPSAATGP